MKRGPTVLPAWLVQRASTNTRNSSRYTALAPVHSQAEWLQWLARPGMRLALAVFFAALLAHMWVGLRDVLLDYAQPVRIRPYLLIGLAAGLCGLAVWAGFILLRMPA